MTVCNMSIEAGARAGMIAPDETTFAYLAGRPRAPQGAAWERALERWRALPTDAGARFDREVEHRRARRIEPMITYGTNPGMVIPIGGAIPQRAGDAGLRQGARLHGLTPGAADRGSAGERRVHRQLHQRAALGPAQRRAACCAAARSPRACAMLVVPGSQQVKRAAEAEGLDRVFLDAGAEWRESGCSMCLGMNGDLVGSGQYAVSTSNRNFEGRQGAGARTLLASPLTAAASAVRGRVTDPRELI